VAVNGFQPLNMYGEFFGLKKLPFNLTPDPAFLFLPPKHHEALAGLTYAVMERKGFVVLSGDAGTGKTTLVRSFLKKLSSDRIQTSVILNPTLTPSEFLEIVLLDFGIADVPQSKAQRLWKLQEFLLQAFRERKTAILVIDEAHKLGLDVLEEIRLLGNLEHEEHKFLQIVLSGQSELDDILNRDDLRQFKQRIALRLYIDPLETTEINRYLRFRWSAAGGGDALPFTADGIDALILWSRGNPRLINSLADGALAMAYADGVRSIGMKRIEAIAMNLTLQMPPQVTPQTIPMKLSSPAVAVKPDHFLEPKQVQAVAPSAAKRSNISLVKRLAGKFGFPAPSQ
jgi:general secretion pathway protein A